MSSSPSKGRRRFSDSQVPRSSNLLPELEVGGADSSSANLEHRGAVETTRRQLELEEKLQFLSQQLLQSYKETQQWACVGQLAQGLIASSQRAGQLKQRLEGLQEREGGLFLESIRERSLPREDDHAQQSREEPDTSEVANNAEDSSRIPVDPDTQDCWTITKRDNYLESVQASVDHKELPKSLSDSPSGEGSVQEPGVKLTAVQSENSKETAAEGWLEESDSVFAEREESLLPVGPEQLPGTVGTALGRDSHARNCEDANSASVLLAGNDTTANRVNSAENINIEVESTSSEVEREAIVPLSKGEPLSPSTLQATAVPVETNISCQREEKETGSELEDNKKTTLGALSLSKSESSCPDPFLPSSRQGVLEATNTDGCQQQDSDKKNTLLNTKADFAKLDLITSPQTTTTAEQTKTSTDRKHCFDPEEDTTTLTSGSLEKTNFNPSGDDLEPTKSASSLDRKFGLVDECLGELTHEIEALVIASEISSDTSEQYYSPPESITVEVEYEESLTQQPKPLEEIVNETAATSDKVVPLTLQEEQVEKSDSCDSSDTKEIGETFDTEPEFEKEGEGRSEKDSILGTSPETKEDINLEIEPREVNFETTKEESREREDCLKIAVESELRETPETEPREDTLGEDSEEREKSPEIAFESVGKEFQETQETESKEPSSEEDTREKEESPEEIALKLIGEILVEVSIYQKPEPKIEEDTRESEESPDIPFELGEKGTEEASGTVDSEPKEAAISSQSPHVDQSTESYQFIAQFGQEAADRTTELDTAIGEVAVTANTAGVLDGQSEEHTKEGDKMEVKVAVKYSVRRSSPSTFSDYNRLGSDLYRIDAVSCESRHKPVERSLEDFVELHQRLSSLEKLSNGRGNGEVEGVPWLDLTVSEQEKSSHENGSFIHEEEGTELVADHKSQVLETFLNQVANDPRLGNEPLVTNFLSPTSAVSVSPTTAAEGEASSLSLLTYGVKEEEPNVDDVTINGTQTSFRLAGQGMYMQS